VEQLFDSIAIRINGPKAWDLHLLIDWVFTDLDRTYRTELTNGVLIQHDDPVTDGAGLTITLTKVDLLRLLGGAGLDIVTAEGDTTLVTQLLAVLDRPNPGFAIVTP